MEDKQEIKLGLINLSYMERKLEEKNARNGLKRNLAKMEHLTTAQD